MILGTSGEFRYVSPAIKELMQYEPDELIGLLSTDFVHPDDLHTVLNVPRERVRVGSRDGHP